MLKAIAVLDELLEAHATVLGRDFTAYRNHTYRVVNLCVGRSSTDPRQLEKIAVAAAAAKVATFLASPLAGGTGVAIPCFLHARSSVEHSVKVTSFRSMRSRFDQWLGRAFRRGTRPTAS